MIKLRSRDQRRLFQRHTGEVSVGLKLDSPPASCLAIHTALPYDYCFKKGKLISYEKLEKHPGSQLHNRNVPFYLQAEFLFLFLKVFLDVQWYVYFITELATYSHSEFIRVIKLSTPFDTGYILCWGFHCPKSATTVDMWSKRRCVCLGARFSNFEPSALSNTYSLSKNVIFFNQLVW